MKIFLSRRLQVLSFLPPLLPFFPQLRRDDDNHELRRRLGEIQVVQSDLLPLLRDHSGDAELFDLVLRVLVNLTNPGRTGWRI